MELKVNEDDKLGVDLTAVEMNEEIRFVVLINEDVCNGTFTIL